MVNQYPVLDDKHVSVCFTSRLLLFTGAVWEFSNGLPSVVWSKQLCLREIWVIVVVGPSVVCSQLYFWQIGQLRNVFFNDVITSVLE